MLFGGRSYYPCFFLSYTAACSAASTGGLLPVSRAGGALPSLGGMPPVIPPLPVASSVLTTPMAAAPSDSSSTPSSALSVSDALNAMLSSLAASSSLPTQGDRVPLGAGLPAIPRQLMDKIQRWEYIELADLLPASSTYDALANSNSPARFMLFPGCEIVRPKKRQILSILDWVQAFTVYSAAMARKYPEAVLELLAYQLTIIKASQQYDGLHWTAYDTHFRIHAAASNNRQWSKLDTDLYTRFFTGRARMVEPCSICDSTLHLSHECPSKGKKRDLSGKSFTASTPLVKKRKQWPSDVCAEFNTRGSCMFKEKCKYRHSCGECGGNHPAKLCQGQKRVPEP